MDAFPAFFPLTGKRIAVVGAGEQAEAKLRLFKNSPAEVVRIPAGPEALDAKSYTGVLIAFIAAPDEGFGEGAAAAARAAGALVNVIDRPHLSDFTMPAIVDRGSVVAGIGTGGASPVLATRLRQELEARWPQGLGRLAELSRRLQAEVRALIPDLTKRRMVLRRLLDGPAAEAALAGDLDKAEALARQEMAANEPLAGVVRFLVAPPKAEMLTLRALRMLSEADRITFEPGLDPQVTALARRDAVIGDPERPETLAAWAAEGLAVLVVGRTPDPECAGKVQALGARTELLS